MLKHFFTATFLISCLPLFSQNDSISFFSPSKEFNKKRFYEVVGTESVLYAGSLSGLNELWYKDFPRNSFHFFDDNTEWLQMDKAGHAVTSYYIGRIGIGMMKWTGIERKKAIWYGGTIGSIFLSTVELLDGFSSRWGFSWGDFGANSLGTAMVISQAFAWDEQRIVLKFSFHKTNYPEYRKEILGNNLQEQILKDYNGQTYWLSGNISSFMSEETKFPKWLNIAFGYGAEGMTGGRFNPPFDKNGFPNSVFERYRKFYFSLDADVTRVKIRSKLFKTFFGTFGFIKIPAPALEFSKKGIKIHALFF